MSALDGPQRALLRHMGGWSVADALLDPEHGCKHMADSHWGGSYDDPRDSYFQCDRRGVEVYTYRFADELAEFTDYGNKAECERVMQRDVLLSVRWSQLARYATQLPADVRDELRAARDHHRALNLSWARRSDVPPGKRPPPFDEDAWAAHMAEYRPAVARLNAAVAAAVPADEPVQLGLFDLAAAS